ncbi:MAG: metal ABC transporter substrate-binding protein [Candidatus Fimivivens sp.]
MKKLLTMILSAAVSILPLAGCGNSAATSVTPTKNDGQLSIVTTIFPPYDFTREIVGAYADVTMLLPPGSESHTYEPAPQDIITLQNCDLFIYVGGKGDVWIDDILDSMGDKAPNTLKMMDSVTTVEEQLVEGMEQGGMHQFSDKDTQSRAHKETEYDEHVWTSPANAIKIVNSITDAIATLDSANTQIYRANADAYIQKLATLDDDFYQVIKTAKRNTIIVGDRFPFRYFADAYGLNYYAAFPGCSSETEASAATVAFLTDKVMAEGIPAVLYIEFSNHKIADSIAETAGAKTLLLHSCHSVSKEEIQAGVSYLSLMQNNIETIRQALN